MVAPLDSRTIHLVDMAGDEVHRWTAPQKPGEMAYLTDRGTVLAVQRQPNNPLFQDAGGDGGRLVELAADGTVLWRFDWNGESGCQHHDLEELPNGNILFVAWDRSSRDDAIAAGRDPELLEGDEWWAGAIYEVRPIRPEGGEIVWSWHAMDHLVQNYDESLPNFGRPADAPHRIDINGDRDPKPPTEEETKKEEQQMAAIGYAGGDEEDEAGLDDKERAKAVRKARIKGADWMHTNAVAYHAGLDQIAISVRRFDEIWILDHSTTREEAAGSKGDLLYRWGNPFAYGAGEFEERPLLGQHNVQWIPEGHVGEGNLIVFNNGGRSREWSTIVEWWPPLDERGHYRRTEGDAWGPHDAEWDYAASEPETFYSPFISGVQRLPNGNTLVCSGAPGRVFEVDLLGSIVWDWRSPFTREAEEEPDDGLKKYPTAIFRAIRYGPNHPGIMALREAGVALPEAPGAGPATNQYAPPEGEAEGGDE